MALLLYIGAWLNVLMVVAVNVIRNVGKIIHQYLSNALRYIFSSTDNFTPIYVFATDQEATVVNRRFQI